jgi:hypothetical protein
MPPAATAPRTLRAVRGVATLVDAAIAKVDDYIRCGVCTGRRT